MAIPSGSDRTIQRLREHAAERARRTKEALRLYEPTGIQELFHQSNASERLVIGGSRSGKSLSCYTELARAATGQDPYKKYRTDRPLTIWLIVYEESNIGRTAYRLLFRPGAFQIIRDRKTNQWRSWRPWEPDDKARENETKLSGPLIPRRFAPQTAFQWIKKKAKVFRKVELAYPEDHPMHGTEIYAFSSASEVPMGDPVDLIMIDEDIQYPDHYPELQARLSDRKGRIIWSAKPKTKNNAMIALSARCQQQKHLESPDAAEFRLVYSENPYMDRDEVRKRLRNWTEAERRVHDLGEFSLDLQLLYPEYDPDLHNTPWLGDTQTGVDIALSDGRVPADWTRYMVVDPGFAVCGVLFLAVPPPIFGECVVAYDELYLAQCTPQKFAQAVAMKTAEQHFYAFIIDDHGSRQRSAATGRTVKQHYMEELALRGVRSETTGHGFIRGSDDVEGRTMAVRRWLSPGEGGVPKFRVVRGRCPNLEREFRMCRRRILHEQARDQRVDRDHHLLDCAEYAAAYGVRFRRTLREDQHIPQVVLEFREWMAAERRGKQEGIYLGPGKGP